MSDENAPPPPPPALSPFLANLLSKAKSAPAPSNNLKNLGQKKLGKGLSIVTTRLQKWFYKQCHNQARLRTTSSPDPSSITPNWSQHISLKCIYATTDYSTSSTSANAAPTAPSLDRAGGSLAIIFSFYARLQKPGVQRMKQGLTFTEVAEANTSLSYFELLCALRDFKVVPLLIPQTELLGIWKFTKARRGRTAGVDTVLNELDFESFVSVLCCVAIVAFTDHREQFPKTPAACVASLIRYLDLGNARRAMETVRVMGKATSSRINYRSKGETNPENRETFRDERDLERASFVRRHGQICTNSSDKSLTSASVSSRFVGDDTRRIWEDARKTVDKGGGDDFTAFTGASGITHSTGFWSGASKETSNTLGLEHAELLSLYSKDLNRLLLPYMYKTTVGGGGDAVAAMSNWKEYGGAFLDFGTVSEYNCRSYKAAILVINTATNPILVTPSSYRLDGDGRTMVIEEEAMRVAFTPAVVPPGLRTLILVTVAPGLFEDGVTEVLGGVDLVVSIVNKEQGKNERADVTRSAGGRTTALDANVVVKVPMYFKVCAGRTADCVGSYVVPRSLRADDEVRRKGVRVKKRSEKMDKRAGDPRARVYSTEVE